MNFKQWIVDWLVSNSNVAQEELLQGSRSNYFEKGWLDSFSFLNLVNAIEQAFDIRFSNDDFQSRDFSTIEGLISIVLGKVPDALSREEVYSYQDIIFSLRELGLQSGDHIFVHSNIAYFGRLIEADDLWHSAELFTQAIIEVVEENGTLVVPTFSHSFFNQERFILESTPSLNMGIFAECVRRDPRSLRSVDPNFSVSAIGGESKYFTHEIDRYSFGTNSFWARFLRKGGIIVNLNFDAGSTFIHYVERELKVPYRWDKEFTGLIQKGECAYQASFFHFVYDLQIPEHVPDFTKFDKQARTMGAVKTRNLGRGQIVVIKAQDCYDIIQQQLKVDKDFLIYGSGRLASKM